MTPAEYGEASAGDDLHPYISTLVLLALLRLQTNMSVASQRLCDILCSTSMETVCESVDNAVGSDCVSTILQLSYAVLCLSGWVKVLFHTMSKNIVFKTKLS